MASGATGQEPLYPAQGRPHETDDPRQAARFVVAYNRFECRGHAEAHLIVDRHRLPRLFGALLSSVGLLSGCFAGESAFIGDRRETVAFGRAVSYEPLPCWFDVHLSREIVCGQLIVPENWTAGNSRVIHLPVVVFRAAAHAGSREPVVFLNGGPGASSRIQADADISWWVDFLNSEYWTHGRDFIVLAQRGTTWTDSNLSCPSLSDAGFDLGAADAPGKASNRRQSIKSATHACWQRLVADGHDLAAYNSTQSAMDVAALRIALGIPSWSIYAQSYGTRFALILMRNHPAGIRTAILDSVYPPELTQLGGNPSAFQKSLLYLFDICESDFLCNSNYPDMRESFASIVERLRHSPLQIAVLDRHPKKSSYHTLDPSMFLQMVFLDLSRQDRVELVPNFIDELQKYPSVVAFNTDDLATDEEESIVEGAYLAIVCNDHNRPVRDGSSSERGAEFPLLREWVLEQSNWPACEDWPTPEIDAGDHDPAPSDIPVLILAGALDPITPPDYAELAAATVRRAHVFLFPAVTHGVIGNDACIGEIVVAFLAAPETRPDVGCPDHAQRLEFSPSVNARALALLKQGDRAAAEPLLKQVLDVQTRTLEPDHRNLALTANNLGIVYFEQQRYDLAEPLLKRALAIRGKVRGPRSAETAVSSFFLALLYHAQGRREEAERFYQRALRIQKELRGTSGLEGAITLEPHVELLRSLGRHAEADELAARSAP